MRPGTLASIRRLVFRLRRHQRVWLWQQVDGRWVVL